MLAIFHDLIKESVEVFIDELSVFGNSFNNCLKNLDKMLQRCKDANLVLNWEKCHFMVKEGIMLGQKVFGVGLEVDKAKIDVISKLPPPTNFKGIRSFLGHVDYSALRHLFKKQDAKPRFIRWILLVQEFDIEIKDKKGTKIVAADHLSRINNDETVDYSDVDDNFPIETLMEITTNDTPWKYKGLKAEIYVLTKKIDAMSKGKSEKGLVAKSFDWDEESISSEDEGTTKIKAFMAIAKDKPSIGKANARSG
ncbi:hypothetical protein Tco_0792769 [Tanacetum coccineum]